ncbi:MAG: DUF3576 domain-containing protein [Alphaproteobacteria bacterium]|nr:DUF3576 domain-containing protein [Alphaproteobacteria bacterium]
MTGRRVMYRKLRALGACALSLGVLAACSGGAPQRATDGGLRNNIMPTPEPGTHMFGGDSLLQLGGARAANDSQGIGVNAYLWRGALETLKFMPLASADPFGGVIITDWYQPPAAPGERFKATAYILGRQLRADAIRISVFRQVQENGAWVDAPVAASTANELEDKVLVAARDLRAQSASTR